MPTHFLNLITKLSVCLEQVSYCVYTVNKSLSCSIHLLLILLQIKVHLSALLVAHCSEILRKVLCRTWCLCHCLSWREDLLDYL